MTLIVTYLKDGRLLEKRDEAKKLRIGLTKYILIDEVLYKRGFSQLYLRCLAPDEANYGPWNRGHFPGCATKLVEIASFQWIL